MCMHIECVVELTILGQDQNTWQTETLLTVTLNKIHQISYKENMTKFTTMYTTVTDDSHVHMYVRTYTYVHMYIYIQFTLHQACALSLDTLSLKKTPRVKTYVDLVTNTETRYLSRKLDFIQGDLKESSQVKRVFPNLKAIF